MEPGIVRTRTGRIIAGLRNHAGENAIWMTYSDDNGNTWAPVFKTGACRGRVARHKEKAATVNAAAAYLWSISAQDITSV